MPLHPFTEARRFNLAGSVDSKHAFASTSRDLKHMFLSHLSTFPAQPQSYRERSFLPRGNADLGVAWWHGKPRDH